MMPEYPAHQVRHILGRHALGGQLTKIRAGREAQSAEGAVSHSPIRLPSVSVK
jgi:hypothetical protein